MNGESTLDIGYVDPIEYGGDQEPPADHEWDHPDAPDIDFHMPTLIDRFMGQHSWWADLPPDKLTDIQVTERDLVARGKAVIEGLASQPENDDLAAFLADVRAKDSLIESAYECISLLEENIDTLPVADDG